MSLPLLSRRGAMGRLGLLLAAGLWPGVRLAGQARSGGTTFVVINDLHHDNAAECDPWFEALFRQIAARHPEAVVCLALGDLANRGLPESLSALARLAAARLPIPFLPVPGNHDQDVERTTRIYLEAFPGRLNYVERFGDWQFVLVDTTQGADWADTAISDQTLAWLDATLPSLDPARPTVLGSHFPLSNVAKMCPLNADDLLRRFLPFNLRGVFAGHYHAQTVRQRERFDLVTNVCCGRATGNHDGSERKGYFVVRASASNALEREFVPFAGPA
jgi:3',5'-cyclic AMP phosphodiesterase CpdA